MVATLLIRATDALTMKKGDPSVVRDEPWNWGSDEGLPNWVRVTVSDAPASDLDFLMQNWLLRYTFTVLADTAAVLVLRSQVDPAVVSAVTFRGRDEMKLPMQAWAVADYGAVITSASAAQIVTTFPKPLQRKGVPTTQAELEVDFADRFNIRFAAEHTRYTVASADIGAIVAGGGLATITKAQALILVPDKFLN